MKHKTNQSAHVEVYNYKTRKSDFIPCVITKIVTATDRPYRVNVKTQDGRFFYQCAPECIVTNPQKTKSHV